MQTLLSNIKCWLANKDILEHISLKQQHVSSAFYSRMQPTSCKVMTAETTRILFSIHGSRTLQSKKPRSSGHHGIPVHRAQWEATLYLWLQGPLSRGAKEPGILRTASDPAPIIFWMSFFHPGRLCPTPSHQPSPFISPSLPP